MSDRRYSVGELAAITHLSVRTLQYYDNIGLLPASRDQESGRRFYSGNDLIRLEQILFYKTSGFSLEEIRANLTDSESLIELRDLFIQQEYRLLRKMEKLHNSFAAIDASIKVLDAGTLPPFEVVVQFLSLLPGEDVFEWAPSLLDAEQRAVMAALFKTLDEAQSFYHLLKSLLIDALFLSYSGIPPAHPQAQELAKKWQEMMKGFDGNPAVVEQFTKFGETSEFGTARGQDLLNDIYQYIQSAVESADKMPPA